VDGGELEEVCEYGEWEQLDPWVLDEGNRGTEIVMDCELDEIARDVCAA
jgi:hypothetical protein